MPKLSADALKAKIAQLQKQLSAAQNRKAPAIKKVKALMKKLGVTLTDLAGTEAQPKGRPGRKPRTPGKKGPKRGGKVAIKYRDDKGNTWSGRGKTPRWLAEAEKAGARRDHFLIKK
jgi:DNA-binding protein H-NS